MSKLERLMGKNITIMVNEVELEIAPLKMKDLPMLMELNSTDIEKQAVAFEKLIKKTLKKSVPDATDEEIENVALNHFQVLSEAIMKVNGLDKK